MVSKFDSVDSIVEYLRESTLSSTTVDPTKKDSSVTNNKNAKSSDKKLTTTTTTTAPSQTEAPIQVLPKGRVKYGPITVNPRKQPSKTLFTGRRSKYEALSGDEEEKRRDRRERNRVAATKCREKRENVLAHLENEYNNQFNNNKRLVKLIQNLEERKNQLELTLNNHLNERSLINNNNDNKKSSLSMIFGDVSFLSSIIDAPPLPLPTSQQQQEPPILSTTDDEESSNLLDPTLILTNSAYNLDQSDILFIPQSMTTSSIDRLVNTLNTPTISMESTNNNHSILVNSAVGSSCAKQHSNSSEEDSSTSKCTKPYVY